MNPRLKRMVPWLVTAAAVVGIGVAVIAPAFVPPRRFPFAVQREQQRKIVRERVQRAGGWEALRRECEQFYTNGFRGFHWEPPHRAVVYHGPTVRYETNIDCGSLPPVIASLQPRDVRAYPSTDQPGVVHIEFFGLHRTGGVSIPHYELCIVCGRASDDYTPEMDRRGVTITGEVRKIAPSVFEAY